MGPILTSPALGLLVWTALQSPADSATTSESKLNALRGKVVSKADGKPIAGAPVVLVHAVKGYLTIGPQGITGSGAEQLDIGMFASRNSKVACDAITTSDGSFVLRGFCAPNERWIVAAGNRASGFCLRQSVIPADFCDSLLEIEIEAPAFITTRRPPELTDATFRSSVKLAIIDPMSKVTEGAGDGTESHIMVYAWPENPEDAEWRLGPLLPGYTYQVTHSLWSPNLRFDITLFERLVYLRPGLTEAVSMEPGPGMTLNGRISDNKNQPLADVNVLLRTRSQPEMVIGALSNAEGRYSVKNVPAGSHELELRRHARPTAPT